MVLKTKDATHSDAGLKDDDGGANAGIRSSGEDDALMGDRTPVDDAHMRKPAPVDDDAHADNRAPVDDDPHSGTRTSVDDDVHASVRAPVDDEAQAGDRTRDDDDDVLADLVLDMSDLLTERFGKRGAAVALALVQEPNRTKAAALAGVSRSTVYRLLRDGDFVETVAELREESLRQSFEEIAGAALLAARTLIALLGDPKAAIQLQAAKSLLQINHKERELKEVTRKLEIIADTQALRSG